MITPVPGRDGARPMRPPELVLDPLHEHDAACFWDVHECRWRCVVAEPQPMGDPEPAVDRLVTFTGRPVRWKPRPLPVDSRGLPGR